MSSEVSLQLSHPQTLTFSTSLTGAIGLPIPVSFDPITVAVTCKANTMDHYAPDHLLQEHSTFLFGPTFKALKG